MGDFTTGTTATVRAISPEDFDSDTLRTVAMAYRDRHRAGYGDLPSFNTAVTVYRSRHPDVPEGRAAEVVGQMIVAAINADPLWFWRDVPVDIRYPG